MKSIKVIGPFITNYSISRVNRGLAIAVHNAKTEYSVKLFQHKEKIDKWPDENDFKKLPAVRELWSEENFTSDIAIYSDFPKEGIVPLGLKDLESNCIIPYIAWEESIYPKIWVDEINQYAHGVAVISSFVREVLFENGVKVPIKVVDIGIDDAMRVNPSAEYSLKNKSKFKFLHVSSARARKGFDLLIKAFCEEFSTKDDVSLVVKSFPGPNNQVEELVKRFSTENTAPIEHITSPDITDQEMVNLINSCDCGVYPSRAEGFGLPIAEAMLHRIPVITTNYSGQLDFANDENTYLLDYTLESAVNSELGYPGSKWAEPDFNQLKKYMRFVYENRDSNEIQEKIELARKAAEELTWDNAAGEMLDFVRKVEGVSALKSKNYGVITPVNKDDGIAEYTHNLVSKFEKSFSNTYYLVNSDFDEPIMDITQPNVEACWQSGDTEFKEVLSCVNRNEIDIIHIQYHSGVNFTVPSLDKIILSLKDMGKDVYVTLHAVSSESFNIAKESKNLKMADRVFVHNNSDKVTLGLDNVTVFTLPKDIAPKRSSERLRKNFKFDAHPIIASHGKLVLRKSNILEIINAISILKEQYPDILYLAINAVVSSNSISQSDYEKCTDLIKEKGLENNVIFIKDFLTTEQIYVLLQLANCTVFPYYDVGESASAAVSKSLAAGVPTIVTDIKMFSEFSDSVYKIDTVSQMKIANAVVDVLSDSALRNRLIKSANQFIQKYSFHAQALKMINYFLKENKS